MVGVHASKNVIAPAKLVGLNAIKLLMVVVKCNVQGNSRKSNADLNPSNIAVSHNLTLFHQKLKFVAALEDFHFVFRTIKNNVT